MVAKKKEENLIEETKEEVGKLAKKVGAVFKDVEEGAEELVEEVKEALTGKKAEGKKKTSAKKTSKKEASDKKIKLEELKKKARALEKKVSGKSDRSIKSEVTGQKEEKKDMLVPIEDYLKASIHLGTRVITPHMRKYVYRRRADGLAVFNTDMLDDEIKKGAEYLAKYNPEQIVVICKREAGWKAVAKFAETFGIKYFTKKYPAGTLTNTNLDDFFEKDLVFICDPWLDKNALKDSNSIKIPVLAVCDTNNYTFGIDQIIPGNNKSNKSLGMIFYLLTKLYSEKKGLKVEIPSIQEFVDDWDNLTPPK